MTKNIVIYQDEGVGKFCLSRLQILFSDSRVILADSQTVIDGSVFAKTDLFIMPGGADLPYCRKLNGTGNRNIRHFVEGGGAYLGICAGAYYACTDIEYHKGLEDEICGPRELSFIDATAYGSLRELGMPYNNTLHSAAITSISGKKAFYNGGCSFTIRDQNAEVLAIFDDIPGKPPAIVRKSVGLGKVVLSGVHLEIDRKSLQEWPISMEEKKPQEKLAALLDEDNAKHWKNLILS